MITTVIMYRCKRMGMSVHKEQMESYINIVDIMKTCCYHLHSRSMKISSLA